MKIKNDLSVNLGKRKWYNPNSYTALDAAVCFIIILVLFEIFSGVIGMFFRYLWNNQIIKDYMLLTILSSLLTQGIIISLAIAFAKIRRVSLFDGGGFRYKLDMVDILFGVALVLGILFVFNSVHSQFIDDVYYAFYGISYAEHSYLTSPEIPEYNVFLALIYMLFLVPVLPAICEEVLFRGVIMRGFSSLGAVAAVLISSTMFSLMHGSFEQMILQFIGGVAIGAVTIITKNFLLGAVMHFANNFFAIVLGIVQVNMSEGSYGAFMYDAILIICGLIFIIISVLYFGKKVIVNDKNKYLGRKPKVVGLPVYACLTKTDIKDSDFTTLEAGEVDVAALSKNKNNLFLYKNKFVGFNRCRSRVWEYILIAIGGIFAISLIFLTM